MTTLQIVISAVLALLVMAGISMMSRVQTAVRGNLLSAFAMLAGVVAACTMLLVRIANTDELPDPEAVESLLPDMDGEEEDGGKTPEKEEREIEEAEVQTDDLTIPEVVEHCMPSMVAITNTSVQEVENYFGGYGFPGSGNSQSYESVSMGTGVIVGETDEYLLIATNAHVVDGAKELSVAFVDEQAAEAEIVGTRSADDLAVIRVNKADLSADTLDAVSVIRIGSSADLAVGEQVVAIGNALGYGQSVSTGIVSALGRTIDLTEDSQIGLIQTDAAINPGNSGGALLNMYGELVGINSAKFADTNVEGMGYAIPITEALPILTELANGESGGTVQVREDGESDAYLGISCATISGEYASYYGIPEGVYVDSVEEGDPMAELEMGYTLLRKKDKKGAKEYFQKASDHGSGPACFALIDAILGGKPHYYKGPETPDAKDPIYQQEFKLIERAAEIGDNRGLCILGRSYVRGYMVEKDLKKGQKFLKKALSQGEKDLAPQMLAEIYEQSNAEGSASKAVEYYELSADHGNVASMLALKGIYENGLREVKKNSRKAMYYALRSGGEHW